MQSGLLSLSHLQRLVDWASKTRARSDEGVAIRSQRVIVVFALLTIWLNAEEVAVCPEAIAYDCPL
jgi:hypothetical protein